MTTNVKIVISFSYNNLDGGVVSDKLKKHIEKQLKDYAGEYLCDATYPSNIYFIGDEQVEITQWTNLSNEKEIN